MNLDNPLENGLLELFIEPRVFAELEAAAVEAGMTIETATGIVFKNAIIKFTLEARLGQIPTGEEIFQQIQGYEKMVTDTKKFVRITCDQNWVPILEQARAQYVIRNQQHLLGTSECDIASLALCRHWQKLAERASRLYTDTTPTFVARVILKKNQIVEPPSQT